MWESSQTVALVVGHAHLDQVLEMVQGRVERVLVLVLIVCRHRWRDQQVLNAVDHEPIKAQGSLFHGVIHSKLLHQLGLHHDGQFRVWGSL